MCSFSDSPEARSRCLGADGVWCSPWYQGSDSTVKSLDQRFEGMMRLYTDSASKVWAVVNIIHHGLKEEKRIWQSSFVHKTQRHLEVGFGGCMVALTEVSSTAHNHLSSHRPPTTHFVFAAPMSPRLAHSKHLSYQCRIPSCHHVLAPGPSIV